jgi:hypothetical protein
MKLLCHARVFLTSQCNFRTLVKLNWQSMYKQCCSAGMEVFRYQISLIYLKYSRSYAYFLYYFYTDSLRRNLNTLIKQTRQKMNR